MAQKKKSSPSVTARVAAVLALFAAVIGLVVVVGGSFDSDGERESEESQASDEQPNQIEGCEPEAQEAIDQGYYVIEEGENLTTVSEKTCIDEEYLVNLNPNLDPQQIPIQACVDLVPEGCKAAG